MIKRLFFDTTDEAVMAALALLHTESDTRGIPFELDSTRYYPFGNVLSLKGGKGEATIFYDKERQDEGYMLFFISDHTQRSTVDKWMESKFVPAEPRWNLRVMERPERAMTISEALTVEGEITLREWNRGGYPGQAPAEDIRLHFAALKKSLSMGKRNKPYNRLATVFGLRGSVNEFEKVVRSESNMKNGIANKNFCRRLSMPPSLLAEATGMEAHRVNDYLSAVRKYVGKSSLVDKVEMQLAYSFLSHMKELFADYLVHLLYATEDYRELSKVEMRDFGLFDHPSVRELFCDMTDEPGIFALATYLRDLFAMPMLYRSTDISAIAEVLHTDERHVMRAHKYYDDHRSEVWRFNDPASEDILNTRLSLNVDELTAKPIDETEEYKTEP